MLAAQKKTVSDQACDYVITFAKQLQIPTYWQHKTVPLHVYSIIKIANFFVLYHAHTGEGLVRVLTYSALVPFICKNLFKTQDHQ
jgi:hypothetical protein